MIRRSSRAHKSAVGGQVNVTGDRRPAIELVVCCLLLVAVSYANAAPRKVSVDECVHLGLRNNPGLVGSRAGIDLAEARKREALASRLPSLKLTGGYTRLSSVSPFVLNLPLPGNAVHETLETSFDNNYQAKLTVQQPLFTGFRLQNVNAIAGENAKAARSDYARDRAELIYSIKSIYWRLSQAIQSQSVVRRNIERMQAHLADVQNLQAQGSATRNDVLKVQVQLANARLAEVDAGNGVQIATTALDNLIGLPLSTEVEPVSDSGGGGHDTALFPQSSDSLPGLIRTALASRPEVKSLESRVRASADAVNLARAAWYPQIAATGDYIYAEPNQRQFPPQDKFTGTWDVGVGASLDIWDWGTATHQTAQAKAQLRQAQASLAQLKDGVALEVTQDYLALQEAGTKAQVAETAQVQAEENQRVAQDGFKAGTVLNSDVLDADVNLLQAQLNLAQARADQEVSQAKLERTLGQ